MPERNYKQGDWPKGDPWTLMHAHNVGQVLKAKCNVCHITRFYKPSEVKEVMGNGTIDDVRRKFRCEKCRELILDAEFMFPVGEEAIKMRFRRLVEDLQTAMLSSYPAEKVEVTCDTCMLSVRYDKLGMIEAGGDRPLDKLLEAIVRRNGCTLKESIPAYDKCGAIYSNLPEKKLATTNAYAKAKDQS